MEAGADKVTEEVKGTLFGIMERWGFPTLVAIVAMWVLRQDVLLPLVQSHKQFVEQLGETQQDISKAIQEQTRLLYALQPKSAAARLPDTETAN
jgi:hypothetical protein